MSTLKRVLTASLSDNGTVEDYDVNLDALPVVSERALVECEVALDVCEYSMESLIALSSDDTQGTHTDALRQIVASSALAPFGYSQEEISTVVVSQEGIVDKMKEMANAVWEFIKKMVAETLKFFDQHISNVGRMDKSFRALHAKAKDAKGNPKSKTLSSSKFAFYGLAGKSDKEVVAVINQSAAIADNIIAHPQLAAAAGRGSEMMMELFSSNDRQLEGKLTNIAELWNQGARKALGLEGNKMGYYLDLPGEDRIIQFKAFTQGNFVTVAEISVETPDKAPEGKEVEAPNYSGVLATCEAGVNLAKILMGKKQAIRDMPKKILQGQGVLENAINAAVLPMFTVPEHRTLIKEVIKSYRRMAMNTTYLNRIGIKEGYRALVMGYAFAKAGYKNLDGAAFTDSGQKALPAPSN